MSAIEKLTTISSEALRPFPTAMPNFLGDYPLGPELFALLQLKNGFYGFGTALHVFPIMDAPAAGLGEWNSESLWRREYKDMTKGLLFFSEDVFQDQFCIGREREGVFRFYSETASVDLVANSIEGWAAAVLASPEEMTGVAFVQQWEAEKGVFPKGKRLLPKTPFFLGGNYSLDNLYAGDPVMGMRFKGDLAVQTRHLPEGSKVKLRISPKPQG
jgi:hypothetical protein